MKEATITSSHKNYQNHIWQNQNIETNIGNYFMMASHQNGDALAEFRKKMMGMNNFGDLSQYQRVPLPPVTKTGIFMRDEFSKQDRKQMSNLDKLIEAIIPQIDVNKHSVSDLISAFQRVSVHGMKVELKEDQNLDSSRMCMFLPTLSSLFFMLNNTDKKKHEVVEFHEQAPPYLRKPMN